MTESAVNKVFFIGIGGIGMSALARYFMQTGRQVMGYDRTPSPLTEKLREEGAWITYEDSAAGLPAELAGIDPAELLVVYTPAIPKDSELLQYFQGHHKLYKRSQVLGWISSHTPTIAVAGTHGKTTTSSLIAHVLQTAGIPFCAFLGGIANNFHNNFVMHKDPLWMVAEADEFDRSFLTLHPRIAVVTSVDADHLDIYNNADDFIKGFQDFIGNLQPEGKLIIHRKASEKIRPAAEAVTYAASGTADYRAVEIQPSEGMFQFSISHGKDERQFALSLPGLHNVENAIAAYCVAKAAGISDAHIGKAFMTFTGVERRFHYHIKRPDLVYLDDYAHHPSEINAVRESLRLMYPERRITAVFQPHLFTRTRDFMDEFAASLGQFDEIFLLDIYPARELPIEGISSKALLDKIQNKHKHLVSKEELVPELQRSGPEVLVTLGAGDIDRLVEPIKQKFQAVK